MRIRTETETTGCICILTMRCCFCAPAHCLVLTHPQTQPLGLPFRLTAPFRLMNWFVSFACSQRIVTHTEEFPIGSLLTTRLYSSTSRLHLLPDPFSLLFCSRERLEEKRQFQGVWRETPGIANSISFQEAGSSLRQTLPLSPSPPRGDGDSIG